MPGLWGNGRKLAVAGNFRWGFIEKRKLIFHIYEKTGELSIIRFFYP